MNDDNDSEVADVGEVHDSADEGDDLVVTTGGAEGSLEIAEEE